MKISKYTTILPALLIAGGLASCKKASDPHKDTIDTIKKIIEDSKPAAEKLKSIETAVNGGKTDASKGQTSGTKN
ncbi:hypothetical protein [Candidatus Liberibacter africanus]|uniref:Lipoprotein n=1 Tax=Candidatus Liberibacter africanus PTSAPSY TaxID=1277257 RepID=A0A0G3I5G1_LIBAF|nr:hypothetical protein [Candidatus Liberibacter africanus]AKK20485.1 hypothetical protein G293_04330 [Candidatus Liberibacter africanus PTSAPSY]